MSARRFLFILCWIATLFNGCAPGDLVDLPLAPIRIVARCETEAGEPWTVFLSNSRLSFLNTDGIFTAKVKIFDNGVFLEELPVDTTGIAFYPAVYRSATNSPQPGHEYEIIVEAEGFPTVTSKYVQPEPVPAEITMSLRERRSYHVLVASNIAPDSIYTAWQSTFDVSITFTDPPGDNYYDFYIATSTKEDSLLSRLGGYLTPALGSPGQQTLDGMVMDDKTISGKTITMNFVYIRDEFEVIPFPFLPKPTWFRCSLRTMTKEHYRYLLQVNKSLIAENDPYAQPITTSTNIENGLGFFGGYSATSKKFYFPLEPVN